MQVEERVVAERTAHGDSVAVAAVEHWDGRGSEPKQQDYDAPDRLTYLVATKQRAIVQCKLPRL